MGKPMIFSMVVVSVFLQIRNAQYILANEECIQYTTICLMQVFVYSG